MAIQDGTINVGPSTSHGTRSATIEFNSPFMKIPRVFLTPLNDWSNLPPDVGTDYTDNFSVTVSAISLSGCSFNISRCDLITKPTGTGYYVGLPWDQDLHVQWLAIADD